MLCELPKVLVVDDSKMFLQILILHLEQSVCAEIVPAGSLAEIDVLLQQHDFDVALLDLNLPDAPSGEAIDAVLAKHIPVIVFAGDCSDQTRNRLWKKKIVDYVLKEGAESLEYAVRQVCRILKNRTYKAMVVEDSDTVRSMVAGLLRVHCFQVFEACNGKEGLELLGQHPDMRLVITDYAMPFMDGVQFIRSIRAKHPKEEMAIVGISSHEQKDLSTRFLKSGADDFLNKPFSSEEFYCRIAQNLDLLEYIDRIREYSERDYLTGLWNRRYLFCHGPRMIGHGRRNGGSSALALVDIDYFKGVNDQYGHDVGDAVLQQLAIILQAHFGNEWCVVRLGGEEFCVLLNESPKNVEQLFNCFREEIYATRIAVGSAEVSITVSVGVCESAVISLEQMISCSDKQLYLAKNEGRNQVRMKSCCDS